MLKIEWPKFVTGQLKIIVKGEQIGHFLDQVVQAGISMENLIWIKEDQLSITLNLRDFFPVYRLAKRYKLRVRINQRLGVPFLWKRVKKRKFFAVGAILFFFLLTILSSFVWKVDIEGNKQVPTEQILAILQREGIYPGQLKVKLPDSEQLQYKLQQNLPQASWVGVRLEGTRLVVTVAEKREIEKTPEQVKGEGKYHLIAKKDAMIYQLKVTHGNPLVGVYDIVKKGQVLVSGFYGNPEEPTTENPVGANGVVLGQVWYHSEVYAPLKLERKEYTGEKKQASFLFVGSYILRNPFRNKDPFQQWETTKEVLPVKIGRWELPFGVVKEEYKEMKLKQESLTVDQATLRGIEQARADVLRTSGKYGKILAEKVLHRSVESDKVYLKIHFDVIENIAVPEPLVQGEDPLERDNESTDPTKSSE